jgi:hypothetical protein
MKLIYLVCAATISAVLIFTYTQSSAQRTRTGPTSPAIAELSLSQQLSIQQRINRYFHNDAIEKLRGCWSGIPGKGTVSFKYIYTKSNSRWNFAGVETERSTLPSEQAKLAYRCMSDAVRGSSFPVDSADNTNNKFVLKWTWPVPFPPNSQQLTSAMFAAKPSGGGGVGSGGCDGKGTPAQCYACSTSNQDLSCQTVCVGKETCSITFQKGGGKACSTDIACASGGPFGVVGSSRVMY